MAHRHRTWTHAELRDALAQLQKRAAQHPPFCERVMKQEIDTLIAGATRVLSRDHPCRDALDTAARLARLGHAKLALARLAGVMTRLSEHAG